MLDSRLRRWPNNNTTMVQRCIGLAGRSLYIWQGGWRAVASDLEVKVSQRRLTGS